MYIPKNMQMHDTRAISNFIKEFGFGLLISSNLEATHLPLLFEEGESGQGIIYGHMAKQNPQWKNLEGQRVLLVFSGPHAYISPTWYSVKPAVPTWNYAAIHCYGHFELLNDEDTSLLIDQLVMQYEPALHQNTEIMPAEYKQKLSQGIVGFRIVVDEIQAQEKLGQHRKEDDQTGVYNALQASTGGDARVLASYMKKRNLGIGK